MGVEQGIEESVEHVEARKEILANVPLLLERYGTGDHAEIECFVTAVAEYLKAEEALAAKRAA
jgi:hypothetical protein